MHWIMVLIKAFYLFNYLEADEGEQTLKLRQEDLKPLLPVGNLENVK